MKYNIVLSSEAANDIKEIFEYISFVLQERGIAIKILDLLEKSILSLGEMPGRYRIYEKEPWKTRGIHIMSVKKYLVFYSIDETNKTVSILRILYGSRDIESLL